MLKIPFTTSNGFAANIDKDKTAQDAQSDV